jgi:anionic cell wall polymer biosynthesis LytR-Cps2A-Psr (LCP) family protein
MNGDTALEFVRSRHAVGVEGTDIAREARQQLVIDAIKSKIMQPKVFLSPRVDLAMLQVFRKYVETDLNLPGAAVLARKALEGDKNIKQYLIPQELLVSPPINAVYDQQFVYIPKAGNGKWSDINQWFSSILN